VVQIFMPPYPYPEAFRQDCADDVHGRRIADPYRWLEDPDDPLTRDWGARQEELYQAERSGWHDRGRWEAELAECTAVSLVLTPKFRGGREFWQAQDFGQEHPVLLVRDATGQRCLLDPSALDPSGGTVLETWEPSADGSLLAYQVSRAGTENTALWVLDVATGQPVDGPIDRVRKSAVGWLPGNRWLYYVGSSAPAASGRGSRYHRRVYLHAVGSSPDADIAVFGEGREKTEFYTVAVSPDGRWLVITAATGTGKGTDVYLADLSASPPGQPRLCPVQEGKRHRTRLHMITGTGPAGPGWLRTDWNAPRGRVLTCEPARLAEGAGAWRELIAPRADATLTSLAVLNGPGLGHPVALVGWTRRAVGEVTVHDLASGDQLDTVSLPGAGTVGAIATRPERGHEAWFSYTDFTTPARVLHYDARSRQVSWWGSGSAPGPGAGPVTASVQVFSSRDGTPVRMFVLSGAGQPDQPRPAILTGYGGFGASVSPNFSPRVLAWINAGGIFAWACLRGGGEEGEEWHRAGSGPHKQNTFDDFHAAADYLVEHGWTTHDRLGILGGSNGGLLVGAAMTQRPDKYAAAVCMEPLLDMARYELSGMGPSWVPEYGSAADPAGLDTLLSYSPYHNVTAGVAYPPVLFTAADGDTRTDPLHARKMCAAIQHASAGDGPALLRFEHGVGHGLRAASLTLALHADCLAFLGNHLGLAAPAPAPAGPGRAAAKRSA
jgi:prolyl oligopeptidase